METETELGPKPVDVPPKPKVSFSWASIATPIAQEKPKSKRYLIVDSAAIIKGVKLDRFGEVEAYTIDEVLKEIRDETSRNFLELHGSSLKVREPKPESLQKGKNNFVNGFSD